MSTCQSNPDLFFAGDDSQPDERPHRWEWEAMEACWACPLEAACLAEALRWPAEDQHGVVGGMRAASRRTALKTKPPARQPQPTEVDQVIVRRLVDGWDMPTATRVERAHAAAVLADRGELTKRDIARQLKVPEGYVSLWQRQRANGAALSEAPTHRSEGVAA